MPKRVAPECWPKTNRRTSDCAPAPRDFLVGGDRFRYAIDNAILIALMRHLCFSGYENNGRRHAVGDVQRGGIGEVRRHPRSWPIAKEGLHDLKDFLDPGMGRFGKNTLEVENGFELDFGAERAHQLGFQLRMPHIRDGADIYTDHGFIWNRVDVESASNGTDVQGGLTHQRVRRGCVAGILAYRHSARRLWYRV